MLARDDPNSTFAWPRRADLQQVKIVTINRLANHVQAHMRLCLLVGQHVRSRQGGKVMGLVTVKTK